MVFGCDKGSPARDDAPAKGEGAQAADEKPEGTRDDAPVDEAGASGEEGGAAGTTPSGGADKKPELGKNTFEVPTKAEVAKAKADHKTHLDAGRKAVKAKDYKTGITELGKAKDLSPMNGKVLGELGWAYFLDGQHDLAQTELVLALQHADNDKTRGAVLYNLGRVEEARGNKEIAADHYRASLDRRPNDTVKARLEGLGVGTDSSHAQCAFTKQTRETPWDLCARYTLDMEPSADGDAVECQFDHTVDRDVPEDYAVSAGEEFEPTKTVFMLEADGYKATVFSFNDYDMQMESFVLAVTVGTDWWTAPLADVYHPGVGYADENVDAVDLTAEDLTGDGKKEIVVRWHVLGHDMDPGIEYMEDYRHENVAVVSLDSGAPTWLATVRTRAEQTSGDMDPDAWGDILNPTQYEAGAKESFSGDGSLTVTKAGGEAPKSSPIGTFKLGEYPVRCPSEQDYFGL